MLLRQGNAGSNTVADHIAVITDALAQFPGHHGRTRASKKILVRIDDAGATKTLLEWLTVRRLAYSVGCTLPANTPNPALEDIRPSIVTVGDAFDNALAETINGLYKAECIRTNVFHTGPHKTIADVEYATGWLGRLVQ